MTYTPRAPRKTLILDSYSLSVTGFPDAFFAIFPQVVALQLRNLGLTTLRAADLAPLTKLRSLCVAYPVTLPYPPPPTPYVPPDGKELSF